MSKLSDFHREKTHCSRGHELTEDNIKKLTNKSRHRVCKTCHRENSARARALKKKDKITPIQRFWNKITKTENCWLWTGALAGGQHSDYGIFYYDDKQVYAHRFSYEHFKQAIPEKLQIDHLCRVRHCVNPDHLEAVVQRENLIRGNTIPANNIIKTHCQRGHLLSPDNLYKNPKFPNWRLCLECRNIRSRQRSK